MGITNDIFSQFGLSGIGSTIGTYLTYGLIAIPLFGGLGYIIYRRNYKKKYSIPVKLRRRRANNLYKEIKTVGGIVTYPSGVKVFRIKMGKAPWKYYDTFNTPDPDAMDADDTVHYEQISPDDFIQIKVHNIPRTVEKLMGKFTLDDIKKEYNENIVNHIMEQGEYSYKDEKENKTYIFKLEEDESISYINQFEVCDIYYEPINLQKKALILARLKYDVDNPLADKVSKWTSVLQYMGLIFFAVAIAVIFYVIKPQQ